jgi:hypothetical protein
MSTETHVFFRGKLPTKAALSRAMKELGFPFSIKPATVPVEPGGRSSFVCECLHLCVFGAGVL